MTDMKNKFGVMTGLSDHTLNNITAIASIALGATIIEKHFTLRRNRGGRMNYSFEPSDLAYFVKFLERNKRLGVNCCRLWFKFKEVDKLT